MKVAERLGRRKQEARAGLELARAQNLAVDADAELRFAAITAGLARGGADKLTLLPSPSLVPLSAWIARRMAQATGAVVPVHGEPQGRKDSYGHDRLFVSIALESEAHEMTFLAESGHTVVQWQLASLSGEFLRWEMIGSALTRLLGPPASPANEPAAPEKEPALRAQGLAIFAAADHAQILRKAAGTLGPHVAASPAGWIAAHLALADPGDFVALLTHDEKLRGALSPVQGAIRDATKLACTALRPGRDDRGLFIQLTTDAQALPERRALRIHSEGGDSQKLVEALYGAVKLLSR